MKQVNKCSVGRYFRRSSSAGFTLLEVLVAAALFAIFTATLAQLLKGGMETFSRGQAMTELRANVGRAVNTIASEIRCASSDAVITCPSVVTDGKNKVSQLIFRRGFPSGRVDYTRDDYSVSNGVDERPVTYSINLATNQLLRTSEREGTSNVVLIAENVLLGQRLGEVDGTAPPSFFRWNRNVSVTGEEGSPDNVMEIRLSGLKYVGREELRSTVGTMVAIRNKTSTDLTTLLITQTYAAAATEPTYEKQQLRSSSLLNWLR